MQTTLRATALAATLCLGLGLGPTGAHAATLKISCGAIGLEFQLCKEESDVWAAKTGNEVQVINAPNDSNERLALYQQILGSGSDKIDIYQIDVVWPGLLASHFIDLKPYTHGAEKEHFPAIVANNTVLTNSLPCPGSLTPACCSTARTCWKSTR